MPRSSVNISLVLVSATLILSGCGESEYEVSSTPAGTNPATLPGNASGYHHSGIYYFPRVPVGSGSSFSGGGAGSVTPRGGFGSSSGTGSSSFSSGT